MCIKTEIKRLINTCSCSCLSQLHLQLVLPSSLGADGITLHAFYAEDSWSMGQGQLVSTVSAFTARSEETWICSFTPTNQTQPRATATRESISPVKIPSTVNTVQRLLLGTCSVKQFVQLWFSQEEACVGLLCRWSRSCKAKAAC